MNDMIERGASVLRKAEEAWLLREGDAQDGLAEENSEPLYHAMARALIEAMREPTDEMVAAPDRQMAHTPLFNEDCSVVTDENIKYCWQAMIDAALGWKE